MPCRVSVLFIRHLDEDYEAFRPNVPMHLEMVRQFTDELTDYLKETPSLRLMSIIPHTFHPVVDDSDADGCGTYSFIVKMFHVSPVSCDSLSMAMSEARCAIQLLFDRGMTGGFRILGCTMA